MRARRGVYSLHSTRARVLCVAALCGAGLLLAACMRAAALEPAGFSAAQRGLVPGPGATVLMHGENP